MTAIAGMGGIGVEALPFAVMVLPRESVEVATAVLLTTPASTSAWVSTSVALKVVLAPGLSVGTLAGEIVAVASSSMPDMAASSMSSTTANCTVCPRDFARTMAGRLMRPLAMSSSVSGREKMMEAASLLLGASTSSALP